MQYGFYGDNINISQCTRCGYPLEKGNKFCTRCGSDIRKDVSFSRVDNPMQINTMNYYNQQMDDNITFQNRVKVNYYAKQGVMPEDVKPVVRNPVANNGADNKIVNINLTNLIVSAICVVLWLVAPFEALNLFDLGDQPSAFQLFADKDLFVLVELNQTTAYWSALFSIIAIVVCFVATLAKADHICHDFAIVGVMPMIYEVILTFTNIDESDGIDLFMEIFGIGYWSIMILFFVLICNSRRKNYD